MANEFVVKNGLIVSGSARVQGSITATSFTGSFSGSINTAVSASYALTASYALNAGDSVWTGSAGNIYYNGGNVGIGTTNPSGKLHIADDGPNALKIGDTQVSTIGETNDGSYPGMKIVPYNSNIHIGISSTNDNKINLWHGGSNYTYWQQTSTYSVISNYYTDALVFQVNGGNVGIGITNPAYKLDVIGNTRVYGSYLVVDQTSGYNTSIILNQSGIIQWYMTNQATTGKLVFGNGNGDLVWIGTTGNVGIGTSSPNEKLHVAGNINAYANGGIDAGLFASTSGGSTTIAIRSNGITHFNGGNVGIGTTNPGAKLHLYGSGATELRIGSSTGNTNSLLSFYEVGIASWGIDAGQANGSFFIKDLYNTRTVVTLSNAGNVGIGTTSPATILHLSSTAPQLAFTATGLNRTSYIGMTDGANFYIKNTTAGNLYISDYNEVYIAYGGSSGNVGIGTTSVGAKLEVNSNAALPIIRARYNASYYTDYDSNGIDFRGSGQTFDVKDNGTVAVRVASGGNVGIGTTSPVAKLTVLAASTGYSSDSQIKISDTTTSYYGGLSFDDAGSTRLSIRNSFDGAGSTIGFGFGSSADKVQIIDGTGLIVNEGNVGIGVTTPQAKLQVSGSTNVLNVRGSGSATTSSIFSVDGNNGRLFEVSDDLSNSLFSVNTIAGLPVIEAFADYSVTMGTYGQYVLQVTGSNVGIGSSAPGATLDVNGNVRAVSFTGSFSGSATNAVSASYALTASYALNAGDSIWTGSAGNIYYNGGNVGIGITNPSQKLVVIGNTSISGVTYTDYVQTYSGTSIDFRHQDASVIMRVDTANARVGIGTTSPSQKLHVSGSAQITSDILLGTAGISNNIYFADATSTQNVRINSYTDNTLFFDNFNGQYNFRTTSSYLSRFYIANNGNVGIGTTSPLAKLWIEGNDITLNTEGSSQAKTLYFRYSNGAAINADSYLTFGTGGSPAERMRVTGTGYVGIGTTNPQNKLVVTSDATYNSENSYSIGAASATNPDFKTVIGYDYANDIGVIAAVRMGVAWKNLAILPTGGSNVGIGTTNPIAKLHVVGDTYTVGTIAIVGTNVFYFNDYGGGFYMQDTSWIRTYNAKSIWTGGGYLGTDGGLTVGYGGAGSPSGGAIIAGNVGIGVSTPTAKLFVSGSTNTTALIKQGATSLSNDTYTLEVDSLSHSSNMSAAGAFRVSTNGNTGAFVINGIGNVGIGTNIPQNNLHISGSANGADAGNIRIDSTSQYGGLVINENTTFRTILGYGNAGSIFSNAQSDSTALRAANYLHLGASSAATLTINGSDNVGIGTTSPGFKVHIKSSGLNSYPLVVQRAANTNNIFYIYEDGSGNGTLTIENSGGGAAVSIKSDGVSYFNGGNVGIGITNPSAPLHVYKSDTYSAIISRADWNIAETRLGLGAQYGVLGYISTGIVETVNDTTYVALNYKNGLSTYAEGLRVYNNGNVGIGTTNPSTKLEVGNFLDAVTNKITVAARYEYEPEFNFRLGQSGTNLDWIGAVISSGDDGNYNGKISFKTANAGRDTPTTKMVIKASGNVGIGTTNPSQKLDVAGGDIILSSNATYIRSKDASGNTPRMFGINPSNDTYIGPIDSYAGGAVFYGVSANVASQTFYTGATARLHIASGGNVGIGTTNPAVKLVVSEGVIRATGTTSVAGQIDASPSYGAFRFYDGSTFYGGLGMGQWASVGATTDIVQYLAAGVNYHVSNTTTPVLTVSSGGNVGIGSTSPGQKLEVNGNIKLSSTAGSTSTPSYIWLGNDFSDGSTRDKLKIYLYNSGTGQYGFSVGSVGDVQYHSNVFHDFYTANSLSVRIDGSGNLGIGTTSPASQLGVFLPNTTGGGISLQAISGTTYGKFGLINPGTDNNTYIGSITNNDFLLYTNNSEKVRITSGGNVGIGTNNPPYKLSVVTGGTLGFNIQTSTSTVGGPQIDLYDTGRAQETVISSTDGTMVGTYLASYSNHPLLFGTNAGSSPTARMVILPSGNVGIASVAPAFALDVNGIIRATAIIETSARKYKTNIQNLEPQLNKVLQLQPVTFDWKDKKQENTNIGLIADDVINIYPEFVVKNSEDEIEGIDYSKLTAVLIQSVKELKEIIDLQQQQINALLNK